MRKLEAFSRKNTPKDPKDRLEKIFLLASILIVVGLYWRWMLPGVITWGDWFYCSKATLSDLLPMMWQGDGGLGKFQVFSLAFFPILNMQWILAKLLSLDFSCLERLMFFYPFIFLTIFSPWFLARTLGLNRIGTAAAILAFGLNTHMFFTIGLPPLAIAEALGPLVLAVFMRMIQRPSIKASILLGLTVAFQIMFEVRITYVTLILCSFYLLYFFIILQPRKTLISHLKKVAIVLFLSATICILLHLFWLLPLLYEKVFGSSVSLLPTGYDAASWVKTLSYMRLLHSISLQVPWWGLPWVVNSPSPHFLILPAFVFSVFLLVKQRNKVLFFGLSALLFSFLVKGAQPPLGGIYIWLFRHIPGFSMFRVPGKWIMPLIVSYAVMFGFFAQEVNRRFRIRFANMPRKSQGRVKLLSFLLVIVLFFTVFPVHPISALRYSLIFEPRSVPEEYNQLENFLDGQPDYSRIVWLPRYHRFGYYSSQHPLLEAVNLGETLFSPLNKRDYLGRPYTFSYLGEPFSPLILRLLGVKYIVIPSKTEYEDPSFYYWYDLPLSYYQSVVNRGGFVSTSCDEKIGIYEIRNSLPHFYTSTTSSVIMADYNDILSIVSGADYLKVRKPQLILTTQQDSRFDRALLSSKDFTLYDRTFQDLGVEFAKVLSFPFKIFKKEYTQKAKIRIQKKGTYSLWLDSSKVPRQENNPIILKIRLDGQALYEANISLPNVQQEGQYTKYLKIGKLNLEIGKYTLEINIEDKKFNQPYMLTLSLIEEASRIKMYSLISEELNDKEKSISYIFTNDNSFYIR